MAEAEQERETEYIAIGDIHGCKASLEALLEQLDGHNDRTLVFVGDYIDRGPDSRGVVELLLKLREERDCVFLRGNHEQMLLDAVDHHDINLWLHNGGLDTLRSYDTDERSLAIPDSHMAFYRSTELYFDTPDYFFVHAGLPPGITVAEAIEREELHGELLWERAHLNAPETAWEKKVVFGHTPRPEPVRRGQLLGIDTGCVYRSRGFGLLTAMMLPEEGTVQQECLDR